MIIMTLQVVDLNPYTLTEPCYIEPYSTFNPFARTRKGALL